MNKTKSRFIKNKTKSRFRKNKTKSRFRKNKIMVGGVTPKTVNYYWKIYFHYPAKKFRGWYPWDCSPNSARGEFDVTYSGERGDQQKYIVGFVREKYLKTWMSNKIAIDTKNIQGISVDSVLDNPKIIGDQRHNPHNTVKLSESQQIESNKKNFTISFRVNDSRVPQFKVGAAATDWMSMTFQTHSDNRPAEVPFEGDDAIYPIIFLFRPEDAFLRRLDTMSFSSAMVQGTARDKVTILNTQNETTLDGQQYYKNTNRHEYLNKCNLIIEDAGLSFTFHNHLTQTA